MKMHWITLQILINYSKDMTNKKYKGTWYIKHLFDFYDLLYN